MAQNAPPSQDVQDIQFKLHDRFTIFPEGKDVKSLVSLLAVSSSKGLLFAGYPNSKELKVLKLRDVVDSKATGQNVKVRVIYLPGEPKILACSCDGTMLAVNYMLNNTGFLQIYHVESFVTPTINSLYNLPVAPESNTFALQLLWNPVLPKNIALILTDGSVAMFTLNNGGQYDIVTLGREHQVKSGCWSPKGKQIVFGFAEGKLQQFKPNLQPARAIPCPNGIHPGPFDCIAVHWLSTFQFAATFLQKGQDMCPSLFIVNAPKAGQPSYINYYDICYSAPGPRIQQISFNHIAQWNLLLVTSANGVEVGVLGTKETGETPNWIQYTLLDEARIEMPLTEAKDETYPLGFALDTASSHQVVIGEKKLPVMPMIHVLSTHGHLVSYNFFNLSSHVIDICSPPPPPLNDTSGQFVSLSDTLITERSVATVQAVPAKPAANTNELGEIIKPQNAGQGYGDMNFALGSNMVTSTPAIKDKPMPLFNSQPAISKPTASSAFSTTTAPNTTAATNKPSTGFSLGASTAAASPFSQQYGAMATGSPFGSFSGTAKTNEQSKMTAAQQPATQSVSMSKNTDLNKPLYTVPPTFTSLNVPQQQPSKTETNSNWPVVSSNKINLNTGEIDEVVKQMIVIQMEAFEMELRQIRQQSKQLMENIGSADEIKPYTKQLNDLQEIIEQANDHEFEQDVQSLRHAMNESYAMLAECRTKLNLYNNPDLTRLSAVSSTDPTSRRQLAKLQAYVGSNQNQLSQLNQLIDAQWSQYQDVVRRNSKNQMHIPCLDGIYQRMSKLKDLLSRQRTKMNYIKTKLKQKGLNYKPASDVDVTLAAVGALTKNQSTMESLADSILSMSLSQVVAQTHDKLSADKLDAIRNFTKRQQQVSIIKPKRPDRVGLKSEVILETKLETERKQKEKAKKQQQQQQQQQQLQQQQQYQQQQQQFVAYKAPINMQPSLSSKSQQQQSYQAQTQQQLLKPQATLTSQQQQHILAKPTASKPSIVSSQPPTFITPTSSTAATLSFGGNSSFVKTSMSAPKLEETSKPVVTSSQFTGFGMSTSQAGLNFSQTKPISMANDNKENKTISTPISFSAKVIGGNDAKSLGNLRNKTTTQTNMMQSPSQGFVAPNSTGFSAFTTTKSSVQATSQDKDSAKKADEAPKQIGFATAATSAPAAFTGFAASTKSTTTAAPFSMPLFGTNTTITASTPFAAISSPSSFSFNAIATAPATTVSSTSANNSTNAVTTTTSLAQPATVVTAKPIEIKTSTIDSNPTTATPPTSASASFKSSATSNITASSTKSSAAPNVTITSSGLPEAKSSAATPTSRNSPTSTSTTADPTDSLFGSLNICKPTAKEAGDSNKTGNIFSGFASATSTAFIGPFSFASASGSGDGAKSFLSSTATSGTTASTGFSFVSVASANPTAANVFGKPATTGALTTETATTVIPSSTTETTTASSSGTTVTTSSLSFGTTDPATASTADSLFGSLSVSASTAASTAAATVTTTTTTATGNIFGGGSSVFGQLTTVATTTSTTPMFGGSGAVASSVPSLFGSTALTATTAATPGSGSIFATAATATPQSAGSIFGGIPKPEPSVFGAANTATQPAGSGLFAAAAANSKLAPATGGSIFGGSSSTGFGGSAVGSIFGGGSAAASSPFSSTNSANTAGSIFGAAAAANTSAEGGSIFDSPTQQSAASGGSIFGKSAFGATATQQSTASIFGGNPQSPTSGGFGASGGSIFGGTTSPNSPASGASLFGAAAAATAPSFAGSNASTGFGSYSQTSVAPAFGSPSAGGFGAPASAGFGSPQQQSAFAKAVFGGSAPFGSPQPAFGAQPTFGGAPLFGSPKGFGSFAATSPTTTAFGAPTQGAAAPKGNIFETLGSQDSGLSFGNLAHSTQASQPKPTFGGSSFMNYRS